MQRWDRVRLAIVGVLCAGTVAALAISVLRDREVLPPVPLQPPLPPLVLNAEESIPGWQVDRDFEFRPNVGEDSSARSRYRSTRGSFLMQVEMRYAPDVRKMFTVDDALADPFVPAGFLPLDIQTHYFIDDDGSVKGNASDVPPDLDPGELCRDSDTGSYCFWCDGRRFHLSTILCPTGEGIATRKQFSHQLYIDQFRPERLLPGSPPLFDPRSIIVDISVARLDFAEEEAHRRLTNAWHEWYPWCRARFQAP